MNFIASVRCMIATIACFLFWNSTGTAQSISIQNNTFKRTLAFDGTNWRTIQFAKIDGSIVLDVKSDEFHLMTMDNKTYTIADFEAVGKPVLSEKQDTTWLTVSYSRKLNRQYHVNAPVKLTIRYFTTPAASVIRKNIVLEFDNPSVIDRLEVERFITTADASGGGRGEPVFLNDRWFTGLEYPAAHSRHTNGNTPKADSRHYELVGNYSFIDLEGRDVEPEATNGMLRLMHFPGNTIEEGNQNLIKSKTAVIGISERNEPASIAFMQYLSSIWKQPRSFLHYNNWFEPKAKDLKGDALINIFKEFDKAIAPYNIKMDAMVADDGWQDRKSIWQPSPAYFPRGVKDLKALSEKLQTAGTALGLWLSIGGTNAGVDWGAANGYLPAIPNKYFSQYFKYYSLSHPKYKNEMMRQVPALARDADLVYYKHDFNQLSDLTDAGHPPTDRHGHEANLDAMIDILKATLAVKPDIYQNITNWIWFSPWWLMYSDALWMLAGDDGMNGNYPEISSRAMATTDRDTYIWRMWGNPNDRPLVPVSRLMTHGLIRNSKGAMESPDDTMQDWMDHVLMHYGRGTLLKEWYISPEVMSADHWKALCTVHNWAKQNESVLNNMVFVGGRPDEGNAYGYIGWNGNKAVLVARNPSATTQKLLVPFDASVYYKGEEGKRFKAQVVYPYRDTYKQQFVSGKPMEVELPGYATMAFEIEQGRAGKTTATAAAPAIKTDSKMRATIQVPLDADSRCELLLIAYDSIGQLKVAGESIQPSRKSKAAINQFAGYAIAGMPSDKAKKWSMVSYDLRKFAGTTIELDYRPIEGADYELHLLMERKVKVTRKKKMADTLWPITFDTRRQTIRIW